jgi:hypothetical protein
MILPRRIRERIADGEVTLAFRRWRRPRVRAGTRMRTPSGVVAIDSVERVDPDSITGADARRAGFDSPAALLAALRPGHEPVYRIELHHAGPDPRIALRERASIEPDERAELDARLARLDGASRSGPWTVAVLELIARRPGVLAAELAAGRGEQRAQFKRRVRRLKELGLTESLEVGYRLSPRGRAYLGGLARRRRRPGTD